MRIVAVIFFGIKACYPSRISSILFATMYKNIVKSMSARKSCFVLYRGLNMEFATKYSRMNRDMYTSSLVSFSAARDGTVIIIKSA